MGGLLIGVSILVPDAAVGQSENARRVGGAHQPGEFRRRWIP